MDLSKTAIFCVKYCRAKYSHNVLDRPSALSRRVNAVGPAGRGATRKIQIDHRRQTVGRQTSDPRRGHPPEPLATPPQTSWTAPALTDHPHQPTEGSRKLCVAAPSAGGGTVGGTPRSTASHRVHQEFDHRAARSEGQDTPNLRRQRPGSRCVPDLPRPPSAVYRVTPAHIQVDGTHRVHSVV